MALTSSLQTEMARYGAKTDSDRLFDLAPVPLLSLQTDGLIHYANKACGELLEEHAEGLSGRSLKSFLHDGDHAKIATVSERSLAEKDQFKLRLKLQRGASVPVRVESRVLETASGAGVGLASVAFFDLRRGQTDVRKRAELVKSEANARKASEAKDKLIALLCHELRTPLTPVLAVASRLCVAQHIGYELREVFAMIQRNVSARSLLIDDIVEQDHTRVSVHSTLVKPAPKAASTLKRRYRILLVEDHVDTAEMMTVLLEDLGYAVVTVTSVGAALAIDLAAIDLIVSDLELPDGNGFDLIRTVNHKAKVPAIALSGFDAASYARKAGEAGFRMHLTKPVDLNVLHGAIVTLLEGAATANHS